MARRVTPEGKVGASRIAGVPGGEGKHLAFPLPVSRGSTRTPRSGTARRTVPRSIASSTPRVGVRAGRHMSPPTRAWSLRASTPRGVAVRVSGRHVLVPGRAVRPQRAGEGGRRTPAATRSPPSSPKASHCRCSVPGDARPTWSSTVPRLPCARLSAPSRPPMPGCGGEPGRAAGDARWQGPRRLRRSRAPASR